MQRVWSLSSEVPREEGEGVRDTVRECLVAARRDMAKQRECATAKRGMRKRAARGTGYIL